MHTARRARQTLLEFSFVTNSRASLQRQSYVAPEILQPDETTVRTDFAAVSASTPLSVLAREAVSHCRHSLVEKKREPVESILTHTRKATSNLAKIKAHVVHTRANDYGSFFSALASASLVFSDMMT